MVFILAKYSNYVTSFELTTFEVTNCDLKGLRIAIGDNLFDKEIAH
jgi:hypothetical protein